MCVSLISSYQLPLVSAATSQSPVAVHTGPRGELHHVEDLVTKKSKYARQ